MSEASPQYEERAPFADYGGRRPTAIVDSRRHTARVQFLRRAIVICCVCAVGLIGFILLFDPLHRLELGGFSVGRVDLNGTRITMERPRLSGARPDGQPYEIKAKTVVQDTTRPKIFDLEQVDAKLGLKDGTTTRLEALKGQYNADNDHLDLSGVVRIRNEGRYDMNMKSAAIDMRNNKIDSTGAVVVTIPGGRIEADGLNYFESDQRIAFEGSVHSVFQDADDPSAPAKPPAASGVSQ